MIKSVGSKRHLLDRITTVSGAGPHASDLFSGTVRCGFTLKRADFAVKANDYMAHTHVLASCSVLTDAERWSREIEVVLRELGQGSVDASRRRTCFRHALSGTGKRRAYVRLGR